MRFLSATLESPRDAVLAGYKPVIQVKRTDEARSDDTWTAMKHFLEENPFETRHLAEPHDLPLDPLYARKLLNLREHGSDRGSRASCESSKRVRDGEPPRRQNGR